MTRGVRAEFRDLDAAVEDYQSGRPIAEILADQGVKRSVLHRELAYQGVLRKNATTLDADGDGVLTVRVPLKLRNQFRVEARQRGLWMPEAVVEALRAWLNDDDSKEN